MIPMRYKNEILFFFIMLNNLPPEVTHKITSYIHDLDIMSNAFGHEFVDTYAKEVFKKLKGEWEVSYDEHNSLKISDTKSILYWDTFIDVLVEENSVEEYIMFCIKLLEQCSDEYREDEYIYLWQYLMGDVDANVSRKINKYYKICEKVNLDTLDRTNATMAFDESDLENVKWFFECFPEEKIKPFMETHHKSIIDSIHDMNCHCKGGYGWPCNGGTNVVIKYLNEKVKEYGLEPFVQWYFGATEELILAYHNPYCN